MRQQKFDQGLGLPIAIIIIALALAGSGGSYYVIKKQARQAREAQEKALRDGDVKLNEMRMMRGEMMRHKVMVISLAAQNNSKESGEAMIEDAGGKAKVTIKLDVTPRETPQPAHIHVGACPNPGAVKYPLTNVVNGNSVTQLEISVDELLKNLPLAINVHKSAAEAKVYVACGDIKDDAAMMDKGDAMKSDDAMMKKDEGMMRKEGGMMVPGTEGMMTDKEVTQVVQIDARNFSFSKSEIRVKKGEKVELTLNVKEGFHDWTLDGYGVKTKQMNAGVKETIEFIADKAGTFEYYCSVGSHRAMGMKGKFIVE